MWQHCCSIAVGIISAVDMAFKSSHFCCSIRLIPWASTFSPNRMNGSSLASIFVCLYNFWCCCCCWRWCLYTTWYAMRCDLYTFCKEKSKMNSNNNNNRRGENRWRYCCHSWSKWLALVLVLLSNSNENPSAKKHLESSSWKLTGAVFVVFIGAAAAAAAPVESKVFS